jgi:transposase
LHSHSQCWWRIEILASLYFILYYQPHQLQQCDNANCCRFKRRGRNGLLIDRPEITVWRAKTVLRLPPYHCELNPIELIWAQIKNEVASKNITFKLRDVKPLFQEAVEHVTDENWKKCIEHSKKIENEMRRIGENFGTVPELIISLQDSSSDTSTESDSDKENFD